MLNCPTKHKLPKLAADRGDKVTRRNQQRRLGKVFEELFSPKGSCPDGFTAAFHLVFKIPMISLFLKLSTLNHITRLKPPMTEVVKIA